MTDAKKTLVYFNWPYPAGVVKVTGKFDGWNRSVPMNKLPDGTWELGCDIDPTQDWDYKFDVDGEWRFDPLQPYHTSEIGTTNNYRLGTPFEVAVAATAALGVREYVAMGYELEDGYEPEPVKEDYSVAPAAEGYGAYEVKEAVKEIPKITFYWPYTKNSVVKLTGDFDSWTRSLPMNQLEDGSWELTLELDPSISWDYKFEVDGEWHYDPQQPFHYSPINTINNFTIPVEDNNEENHYVTLEEYFERDDGTISYVHDGSYFDPTAYN